MQMRRGEFYGFVARCGVQACESSRLWDSAEPDRDGDGLQPDDDGDVLWWGQGDLVSEHDCPVHVLVNRHTSNKDAVRVLRAIADWLDYEGLPPID